MNLFVILYNVKYFDFLSRATKMLPSMNSAFT
jgi:hypothetical protein